jgi:hypothetical protein
MKRRQLLQAVSLPPVPANVKDPEAVQAAQVTAQCIAQGMGGEHYCNLLRFTGYADMVKKAARVTLTELTNWLTEDPDAKKILEDAKGFPKFVVDFHAAAISAYPEEFAAGRKEREAATA